MQQRPALRLTAFRPTPVYRLGIPHVRPIKADENEEKPMSILNCILLVNALARLLSALALLVAALRRR